MDLEELLARKRALDKQNSLVAPRNEKCLSIQQLETLADQAESSTEGLCQRCSSLLDRMKAARKKMTRQ